MPPDMAISMRHTKLKAEEAALLAGELNKPSWESRNEGIHERVSFEDTIWGFDLAGGIFYKTPLRVTLVKPDSRAEKAGIRPGDRLLRINDLDTSTLTIQEAHDIIVQSGIHLKISVTSPDDEEDSYYCYEDPIVDDYDSEEERIIEEEKAKKRMVSARVSHYWSLNWPWVSRKRLIYRESNCFMVPSKYEDARRHKYAPLPALRYTDDIVHFSKDGNTGQDNTKRIPSLWEVKEQARKERKERLARLANSEASSDKTSGTNVNDVVDDKEVRRKSNKSRRSTLKVERQETIDESAEEQIVSKPEEMNEEQNGEAIEVNEEMYKEVNDKMDEEVVDNMDEKVTNEITDSVDDEVEITAANEGKNNDVSNDLLSTLPEIINESNEAVGQAAEVTNAVDDDNYEVNGEVSDDDMLNEVLGKTGDSASKSEEDNNILDSILSDDGQNLENSESNNER